MSRFNRSESIWVAGLMHEVFGPNVFIYRKMVSRLNLNRLATARMLNFSSVRIASTFFTHQLNKSQTLLKNSFLLIEQQIT
jgi:hypothetical protein